MAILVVWASHNLDGLTAAAKDRVAEGVEQVRHQTLYSLWGWLGHLPVIRFNRDYMLPALVGAGAAFVKYRAEG